MESSGSREELIASLEKDGAKVEDGKLLRRHSVFLTMIF